MMTKQSNRRFPLERHQHRWFARSSETVVTTAYRDRHLVQEPWLRCCLELKTSLLLVERVTALELVALVSRKIHFAVLQSAQRPLAGTVTQRVMANEHPRQVSREVREVMSMVVIDER